MEILSLIQNLIKRHCLWKEQSGGHVSSQQSEQPEQRVQNCCNFWVSLWISMLKEYCLKNKQTKREYAFCIQLKVTFMTLWNLNTLFYFQPHTLSIIDILKFLYNLNRLKKIPVKIISSVVVLIQQKRDKNRIFGTFHLSENLLCLSSCAQ